MTINRAVGNLPTLPGVVKQLAVKQVHDAHPSWPARLVLSVAVKSLEESK